VQGNFCANTSIFLGIVVRIYFADHDPSHVHVEFGEFKGLIAIRDGALMQGKLPKRVIALIEEWRILSFGARNGLAKGENNGSAWSNRTTRGLNR